MTLRLDIETPGRPVYSADVDMVVAPGIEGQITILPNHAPMVTTLTYGVLRAKRGDEEESFAIGGGCLEVQLGRVIVHARTAEAAEEIDLARAEAARRRAEERLRAPHPSSVDFARAEAALRRAMVRIHVAKLRRRRGAGDLETAQVREMERRSSEEPGEGGTPGF
jgi:F-type H+-transporting ATPase subunit epsilon